MKHHHCEKRLPGPAIEPGREQSRYPVGSPFRVDGFERQPGFEAVIIKVEALVDPEAGIDGK